MDPKDILGVSDEDFAKLEAPVAEPSTEVEAAAPAAAPQTEEQAPAAQEEQQPAAVETQTEEQVAEPTPEELAAQQQAQVEKTPEELEAERVAAEAAAAEEQKNEPDYKALYEGLIKPLRANGKDIEIRSHEELIQLAQQGANYTRKMQQLAPHRKTLQMLENNNLLDPTQLGLLIDLHRKDPAAIQQYLKQAGVNPLDIDVEAEPTYRPGAHEVSDAQVNFREAIEDARSSEVGMSVLQAIDGTWDQASKELVYNEPAIIGTMIQQKQSGVYDRIVAEMERKRTFGMLTPGNTWLANYKEVGDAMVAGGQFNDLVAQQEQPRQTPPQVAAAAPVATRVHAPKPQVTAGDKAAAAAPSRAAAAQAHAAKNPLSMSDDEFMKQFENRL